MSRRSCRRFVRVSMSLVLAGLSVSGCGSDGGVPTLPPDRITDPEPLSGAGQVLVLPAEGSQAPDSVFGAELSQTGRYLLLTGSGRVFHRSARPVHGLRTRLVVQAQGVVLYTWMQENEEGGKDAYFAYVKGEEALGRVHLTTNQIKLVGNSFDPLVDNLRLQAPLEARETELHLVQFHGTPLPEFRHTIERLGGKVLRFLTDHSYLVRMDRILAADVEKMSFVRWMGPYHPFYKLEPPLRAAILGETSDLGQQRYSLLLGERGTEKQQALAEIIERHGGQVVLKDSGGLRMEALLTQEQLRLVAQADEVQYIDRWGGPGEVDMDIVREVGGANSIELIRGWNGQGVRGEVFDTELLATHREWAKAPLVHSSSSAGTSYHGTSSFSNCFAKGVTGSARGMLPGAQGIFFRYNESSQFGGMKSRYDINQELTDPMGMYRAVFQTSSVGSTLTPSYTTISSEVDDYLFKYPILSTQSQSNAGSTNSRPQAWAKNIVSVGGIRHMNSEKRDDDNWNRGASIGPAADGRVKPDLSYFYDSISAATGTGADRYTQFSGTSSATPQTAGHFGLLFQMWHEGIINGHGRKADVFLSRPKMATAKALMINLAHRYDWKAGGANADLDRVKQGWGTPDVRRIYDRASVTSVIDESDVLTPMGKKSYTVLVQAGQTELNVTMVYKDPMGMSGAMVTRVNDLTLRVTSPMGTVYYGNNGLLMGNESTAGGNPNTLDTVENVFLKKPEAGMWKVEVLGDEIVQDAHVATGEMDAVYGLVVSGGRIMP